MALNARTLKDLMITKLRRSQSLFGSEAGRRALEDATPSLLAISEAIVEHIVAEARVNINVTVTMTAAEAMKLIGGVPPTPISLSPDAVAGIVIDGSGNDGRIT